MAPKSVAWSFKPLSTQESSEMCVSSKMCMVVMHVLCSPLCEPYSMMANFSEAKKNRMPQSITLLLLSSFLLVFKTS